MSSWASKVAKGVHKHDPGSKIGSASTSPRPAPMMVARENCLVLKTSSIPTQLAVAKALASQYPELTSKVVPLLVDGHVYLQLTRDADPGKILAEGLILGQICTKVHKLVNSTSNSSILQCQAYGFLPDEEGIAGVKEALLPAKVITHDVEYIGNTGIMKGTLNLLVDFSDASKVPSKIIKVERENWTETVSFRILGRLAFCHYCRETSHSRPNCPHAPECSKCHSRAHPSQRCTVPTKDITPPTDPVQSDRTSAIPNSSKEKPEAEAPKEISGGEERHCVEEMGEKDLPTSPGGDSITASGTSSSSEEVMMAEVIQNTAGKGRAKKPAAGKSKLGAEASPLVSPHARNGSAAGSAKSKHGLGNHHLQLQQQAAYQARLKQEAATKASARAAASALSSTTPSSGSTQGPAEQSPGLDKDGDVAFQEEASPLLSSPSPSQ
jgi:hypothetical protein